MRKLAVVCNRTSGHGIIMGTIGWIDITKKGTNNYLYYSPDEGNVDIIPGGYLNQKDFSLINEPGNKELKAFIELKEKELIILKECYKTGKVPVSEETKAKAQAILDAVNAIKENKAEEALISIIKALE